MPFTPPAVQKELGFSSVIEKGAKGLKARRVQEWLTFHDCPTSIDADYGSATEAAVRKFQAARGVQVTGRVNQRTWDELVAPLVEVTGTTVPANATFDAAVLRVAKAHLKAHPIELGGDNLGPWVRVYCGSDGAAMRWCAGFVTFVLRQASDLTGSPMPIPGSLSCDSLAYQAREAERFVPGTSVKNGQNSWGSLGACQIFLLRHSATDWTHTGFSFAGDGDVFSTIEGNTNDNGSANGFEVCARTRALGAKDFIALA